VSRDDLRVAAQKLSEYGEEQTGRLQNGYISSFKEKRVVAFPGATP